MWRKLKLGEAELTYEDSMKYLGVTLQRKLTWGLHVHARITKCTKLMNLANAAIGQKWGFNPERALWVYTALARSVSTYGAIAWSQSITGTIKTKLGKLSSAQHDCKHEINAHNGYGGGPRSDPS